MERGEAGDFELATSSAEEGRRAGGRGNLSANSCLMSGEACGAEELDGISGESVGEFRTTSSSTILTVLISLFLIGSVGDEGKTEEGWVARGIDFGSFESNETEGTGEGE